MRGVSRKVAIREPTVKIKYPQGYMVKRRFYVRPTFTIYISVLAKDRRDDLYSNCYSKNAVAHRSDV